MTLWEGSSAAPHRTDVLGLTTSSSHPTDLPSWLGWSTLVFAPGRAEFPCSSPPGSSLPRETLATLHIDPCTSLSAPPHASFSSLRKFVKDFMLLLEHEPQTTILSRGQKPCLVCWTLHSPQEAYRRCSVKEVMNRDTWMSSPIAVQPATPKCKRGNSVLR